jgi:hypothetical protein
MFGLRASTRALVDWIAPARFPDMGGLNANERNTLQVGSVVFLGMLNMGLQVWRWPLWTTLPIVAGYVACVIGYSEATMQLERRRLNRASLPASHPAAQAEPAPAEVERAS